MMNSLMESVYARQIDHIISERIEKGDHGGKSDKNSFWGVSEEEQIFEFQQHSSKFSAEVKEAINLMSPGTEQFKLDYEMI